MANASTTNALSYESWYMPIVCFIELTKNGYLCHNMPLLYFGSSTMWFPSHTTWHLTLSRPSKATIFVFNWDVVVNASIVLMKKTYNWSYNREFIAFNMVAKIQDVELPLLPISVD